MAEVRLVITADDQASPVIEKIFKNTLTTMPVAGIASGAGSFLKVILGALAGAVISRGINKFWESFDKGAIRSKGNVESIKNSVSGIEQLIEKLSPPIEKFFGRFETKGEIKSRINEITSQLKSLDDYIKKETYLPYRTRTTISDVSALTRKIGSLPVAKEIRMKNTQN